MMPIDWQRSLARLGARVRATASRFVLRLVDDAPGLQSLQIQVLRDEVRSLVERFQQYGFTSHPLAGAEGIVLSLNGTRGQGVVIAVDDRRYRLKGLAEGEVALYTDEGDFIHLKRDRNIEVSAGASVNVNAPSIQLQGDHISLTATAEIVLASPSIREQGP